MNTVTPADQPAPVGAEELDRLEALAKAATPGPWEVKFLRPPWGDPTDKGMPFLAAPNAQIDNGRGRTYATQVYGEDSYPTQLADHEFGEAFDPPTVLRLIAAARAQSEGSGQ